MFCLVPEAGAESGGLDLPTLMHRANQRRKRKKMAGFVGETPPILPSSATWPAPSVSQNVDPNDWLSPTSAYNESMVSSFHKAVTFSPSTLTRKMGTSAPTLNLYSPDDIGEVQPAIDRRRSLDFAAQGLLSPRSTESADGLRAPSLIVTAATPILASKQVMLRFNESIDSISYTSSSSSSSSQTDLPREISSPDQLRPGDDSASSCGLPATSPIFLETGRSISMVLENAAAVARTASMTRLEDVQQSSRMIV